MGRKKIEIRPLTDERNRNVTFLKRKAGLMKKAWELSVLCGADVSIMIFSAAGKAFEFSSRDLDGEIDRYLEYEGLIERRRAEEFAAMAEAGEDDEDDDEDDTAAKRKGSMSKGGKGAATPADEKKPIKSLKGKEVYKVKMPSRREIVTAAEPKRRKRDKSQQGFIEGLVSDSDGDRDERDRSRESSDLANMNYAMSLGPSNAAAQTLASFPSSLPPQPYSQPLTSHYRSTPHGLQGSPPVKPELAYSPAAYGQTHGLPSHTQPIHYPPNMGGIQWDASLLQRYTEFQMQQNHQRQHRLLLQRQREQLALLGVGIGQEGERRLLDDIFGAGGASGSRASGSGGDGNYQANGQGGQQGEDAGFLWPTFATPHQQSQTPYNHHPQQSAHQDQSNSRESGSLPPDSNRQYNYPDDFDYERHRQAQSQSQSQSIPTPSSISTAAATPWYSNLGDMGGEGSRGGDEVPFGATADFADFIGRKRGGEDLAPGSGGSETQGPDKRVRVA